MLSVKQTLSCDLSCSVRLSVWLRPLRCQCNAASSLALVEQWCLLHLQTFAIDARRVPCNAHGCSTGFLLDQVMTAHCSTVRESFVAALVGSVPAQSMILAKPACSCRVWNSPIYISEIAWLCTFCRQSLITAAALLVVVVQGMK